MTTEGQIAALGEDRSGSVSPPCPRVDIPSQPWENGHVVPDRHYRRLLRDIFGLTDAELGFATQPAATGPPSAIAATMNGRWKVRTEWPP